MTTTANTFPTSFDLEVLRILNDKTHMQKNGPMYLTALQIVHELGGVAGKESGAYYGMATDVSKCCEKWEERGKAEILRSPDGKRIFFHTKYLVLEDENGKVLRFGNDDASLYRAKVGPL